MYRILVIEDEFDIRENVSDLLRAEGYGVSAAINGSEGITKAKESLPDLIICDIMMPKYNGFEVLEQLAHEQQTANIPFIFLTAKTELQNMRKGMSLGADDYVFKPFDIDDLLNTVETRLRKKEVSNKVITELQEHLSTKIPHELRTPLVPILGFSELIEEEEDTEAIKNLVKNIHKSGKILSDKIEKFLLYKDLLISQQNLNQSLQQEKESAEISSAMVRNIIQKLPKKLNSEERCRVEVLTQTLPLSMYHLEALIKELTENALQYSEQDCEVIITGTREENKYKLIIRDSGRGMSEAEINHIAAFKKFGDTHFTDNGFGLGLAISIKILELIGGSLTVNSEVDRFTEVKASFPL